MAYLRNGEKRIAGVDKFTTVFQTITLLLTLNQRREFQLGEAATERRLAAVFPFIKF